MKLNRCWQSNSLNRCLSGLIKEESLVPGQWKLALKLCRLMQYFMCYVTFLFNDCSCVHILDTCPRTHKQVSVFAMGNSACLSEHDPIPQWLWQQDPPPPSSHHSQKTAFVGARNYAALFSSKLR